MSTNKSSKRLEMQNAFLKRFYSLFLLNLKFQKVFISNDLHLRRGAWQKIKVLYKKLIDSRWVSRGVDTLRLTSAKKTEQIIRMVL